MSKITLYSKNNCMQCKMTKRYLTEHNISFEEHNVNEQPQYIDYLKNRGFMALPVIDVDGKQAFSGFRPDALRSIAGQFQQLLIFYHNKFFTKWAKPFWYRLFLLHFFGKCGQTICPYKLLKILHILI